MTSEQLTERVVENCESISALQQQVKTLFESTKQIKDIAESTNRIALNVETMAQGLSNVDKRLEFIEDNRNKKIFAVWQAIVCGVVGFVVSFVLNALLT